MSETTTIQSASDIDEILADLWTREQTARTRSANYRGYASRQPEGSRLRADYEADVAQYDAEASELRADARPYEAEFSARGGWSRFFIVNNTGGHVHSSMNCSTCFASTSFSWLPSLSGRTEPEMVAEFGEMACTVCFPSAPSMKGFGDGTSALARYLVAEKAQRAAEKAAKRAAKDAKAITAPDGSALKIVEQGYPETVRTIVAAERKISDLVQSTGWYGDRDGDRATAVFVLAEALLARGIASERIDQIIERAAKKARKEGAENV